MASTASRSSSQDPTAIKAQLIGSWKLMIAEDDDTLNRVGVSGAASKSFESVAGHFQTFSKADPMDVLTGNANKPLMETCEVVRNAKAGTMSVVAVRGGFQVGANSLLGSDLGVVEYYTRRDLDGAETEVDDVAPNRWACAFVSDTLRICKLESGKVRVYGKVKASAMQEQLERLKAVEVEVDPEAEWPEDAVAEVADDDEDDPNDTRPMWQKRIDKADGIKRTANGTPIINHGPIGGGGGPRTQ